MFAGPSYSPPSALCTGPSPSLHEARVPSCHTGTAVRNPERPNGGIFGIGGYSHKTHEKCADILLSRLTRVKLWQITLSAITTAGFIGAVFGAGKIGAVLGMIVSTALLTLNAYTKNYDLGELSQKHKQAANDLWIIREKYLSLLVDLAMREKPFEALQQQRDEL